MCDSQRTRHIGPVARLDELKGNGRVYLVQVGEHKDPYSLEDLAQWLRTKYALDVRILPRSRWTSQQHRGQHLHVPSMIHQVASSRPVSREVAD